jgi:hypothetical protein
VKKIAIRVAVATLTALTAALALGGPAFAGLKWG